MVNETEKSYDRVGLNNSSEDIFDKNRRVLINTQ